jgi:hypothetical protein
MNKMRYILYWISGFLPVSRRRYFELVAAFEKLIDANQEELTLVRNDIHAVIRELQKRQQTNEKDTESEKKMDNKNNMYG